MQVINSPHYNEEFYMAKRLATLESARIVLARLRDIYSFASVVDIGSGDCVWGVACSEMNIDDYLGVDGEYARQVIPPSLISKFISCDLEAPEDLVLGRKFDLVVSLEVAEHLREGCAVDFIGSLTRAGDVVMFSAAIPGQGGSNHVNEQWQSYWCDLFEKHEFIPFDILRPLIWNHQEVSEYYRQNIVIYCRKSRTDLMGLFRTCAQETGPLLDVVHPYTYDRLRDLTRAPLFDYFSAFPGILRRVLINRLKMS